jgi:polysaccharide pyruvyl transferase WcaK-like protein
MKITIFASIWAQNLWDELILKNEIKLLENKYWKDSSFSVFSYDYKNPFFIQNNIKYLEYFPIWIRQLKNIFRNIWNFLVFLKVIINSDLIIIWWGWIIYDKEIQNNNNPLNQWIFRTKILRFFRKNFDFFAVWLNIQNESNLEKIKKIFFKANNITVRDNYSFVLLNKLNINSSIIKDPVFNDNLNWDKSSLIKKINSFDFNVNDLKGVDFEWKKVGFALRKWYLSNKNFKLDEKFEEWKINEIINYILKNNWEIILLPHSFNKNDLQANDYEFLKKFSQHNWIELSKSMLDTYNYYKNKKIDICLSMRLHSIILSQIYNIPFIWISYSKKTDEILNSL